MEEKPTTEVAVAKVEKVEPEKPAPILTPEDKREITMAVKTTATNVMDPVAYEQARVMAVDLINADALPSSIKNKEQAMMLIIAGREMGMSPMEAIHDLYFVDGKIDIYGKATPAALRRAGWRIEKFDESVPDECEATVYNPKTGERITDKFTFAEAEASGFTKDGHGYTKFGWKSGANRKRKLRYGVLSQILHTYIPEVLGSVAGIAEYSEDYLDSQNEVAVKSQEDGKAQKLADLEKMAEAEVKDENN